MAKICKANPHSDLEPWQIEICISRNCQWLDKEMIDWSSIGAVSTIER
ncbi:MAG: hypothetical protein WCX23_01175 [Candidatus Paceibacterota bacterium]